MIIIGLLLLALVIVIVVLMVMVGNSPVTLSWDAVNLNWSPTALTVYLLGAGTLLLLVLAFAALRAGARQKSAKRRELKRLRRLDAEESRHGTRGGPAAPPVAAPPERPDTSTGSTADQPGPYGPKDDRLG